MLYSVKVAFHGGEYVVFTPVTQTVFEIFIKIFEKKLSALAPPSD